MKVGSEHKIRVKTSLYCFWCNLKWETNNLSSIKQRKMHPKAPNIGLLNAGKMAAGSSSVFNEIVKPKHEPKPKPKPLTLFVA